MRRITSFLLCITLCLASLPVFACATDAKTEGDIWDGTIAICFKEGAGSVENPYLISTGAELAFLAELVNLCKVDSDGILFGDKCYKMVSDIVLNNSFDGLSLTNTLNEWIPIASSYVPVSIENEEDFEVANAFYGAIYNESGYQLWSASEALDLAKSHNVRAAFRGTFDGDGFSISGLYTAKEYETSGLFGYVWGGTIKNVVIENAYVSNTNNDPFSFTGILAGEIESHSRTPAYISNCFIRSSYVEGGRVGGIAGVVGGSMKYLPIVQNCVIDITVNGLIQDNNYAGGAFGDAACSVENCFVTGFVSGGSTVGGFAGFQEVGDTSFTNCLADCAVHVSAADTSDISAGGFIGNNQYDVQLINCFWLQTESSNTSFVESEYYGYAVDEFGNLITSEDVFGEQNILNILNKWVLDNCSSEQLIWLATDYGLELSNIAIKAPNKDTKFWISIMNHTYSPTHIAEYNSDRKMINIKIFKNNLVSFDSSAENTIYKLFSLNSNYAPICESKGFCVTK